MRDLLMRAVSGFAGATIVLAMALACPVEEECPPVEPEEIVPVMQVISRSTGDAVFCWIDGGGALDCWPHELTEEPDFPQGTFRWVSVGDDHLCVVSEDHAGSCWGWGECEHGECDDPNGEFVYIRAGIDVNCGETLDGTVVCWGLEPQL